MASSSSESANSSKLASDAATQPAMSNENSKREPSKKVSLGEDDWGLQLRPIRLLDAQANTQEYVRKPARLGVNWKRVRNETKFLNEKSMSMRILKAEASNPTATAIVTFEGPPQSPYRTGIFQLRVVYGPNYPRVPMEITFLTKIYHPNIDHAGKICLGMLGKDWSAMWSTREVVLCTMALLSDPYPEDAFVPEVASLYLRDRDLYEKNAATYTEKYATLGAALERLLMASE
ncbi:ubiquitin-conjugating enzyme E2 [Apiospora hydei]|uniref:Ubiquitin-conjugating enzyme E2 n=1 Tax=Apiospora hydei TaxID=1337664 RepID=A0ABR1V759_9PEZI